MSKKVKDFRPASRNANKHTARGMGALQKSIQSDGWIGAMTTAADGEMIAGSARIETVAQVFGTDAEPIIVESDGTRPVVVVRTDIATADDKRAQRLALADNRVHEIDMSWDVEVLAGFDADVLGELWTGEELSDLGDAWAKEKKAAQEDAGAQVDKAAELQAKWQTATGQLWQLGEHRLICGDCTDKATVDAVAFGNHVDLWVSDPPYGVSYADKNAYLNAVAKGNRIQTPIINDHLTVEEASELWRKAFGIVHQIAKPGCVYYVNAPQGGDLMMMMMMILREVGWLLKPQIIWVKNNHVLGRSDYQLKHEPILYGWKDGGSHYWCGSRSEISVWNVDKPTNSNYHPTTKPIELMEKAITNSSHAGEIVFDGFLGSGTTLIACEKLGRKCRAVEISPAYCAVAIERWAQTTGKAPILANGA